MATSLPPEFMTVSCRGPFPSLERPPPGKLGSVAKSGGTDRSTITTDVGTRSSTGALGGSDFHGS